MATFLITMPRCFAASLPHFFTATVSALTSSLLIRRIDLCRPVPVTTRTLTLLWRNSMSQPESTTEADSGNSEDAVVQYGVLRRDLVDTWPMGSVVAQGCHASVAAIWSHKDDPHTLRYCSPENLDSMHRVILEVKGEPQILNLSEKLIAGGLAHKLWIEQPENIPTCLATKPYPNSVVALFFKKLKLCR